MQVLKITKQKVIIRHKCHISVSYEIKQNTEKRYLLIFLAK